MANSPVTMPIRPRTLASPPKNTDTTAPLKKQSIAPPTSDRVDRTSFSSIHESNSGIAQTFTDSKVSSYLRHEFERQGSEEAIDDMPEEAQLDEPGFIMLHPDSALHGLVYPCDHFRGWKAISLGGKVASKSFGDLRSLVSMRWEWDSKTSEKVREGEKNDDGRYPAAQSPLEKLPMELLSAIIGHLSTDIPPDGSEDRNIDLRAMLLTSRAIHHGTISTLYAHITIPHSRIFAKFLNHVAEYPSLGTVVRRLDFSHFNPRIPGMTNRERQETQNLIPATLLKCLSLTPNLREFLALEHIEDELSADVLRELLINLPKLRALDLCACSSTRFKDAFNTVLATPILANLSITRLGLHGCTILPASTFTTLLPRLPHLTHLDVSHTRITDTALASIPNTAHLSHLNISRCSGLTGPAVVDFLTYHPAAKTIEYLNLYVDSKSAELLSWQDLNNLLSALQGRTCLRSLNLKGSKMDSSHISAVLPLTKHLEELGLGRHLLLHNIENLFMPPATPDSDADSGIDMDLDPQITWIPHTMRYIDISDLSTKELDLSTLFSSRCMLLTSFTSPLEVIEVSSEVHDRLKRSTTAVQSFGWLVKEFGRRYWLVRPSNDTGSRDWKWGANFWGMRKVPVGHAEVGGMYGLYMFKR